MSFGASPGAGQQIYARFDTYPLGLEASPESTKSTYDFAHIQPKFVWLFLPGLGLPLIYKINA